MQIMFEELNVPISVEEIRKGLKQLKMAPVQVRIYC